MKSKSIIIILAILVIIFTVPHMLNDNFYKHLTSSSEFNSNVDSLKFSQGSFKIHIVNNSGWVAFKDAGNCTGNGTYSDPYVIKDLVIDGEGSDYCILIENTNVYFVIENCSLYNSEGSQISAGIRFLNVNNSMLIENNCSSNFNGILLMACTNNTIIGNTLPNNYKGIFLSLSNENTLLENIANQNYFGIIIDGCNDNKKKHIGNYYNDYLSFKCNRLHAPDTYFS